jgi:hypothetical protein
MPIGTNGIETDPPRGGGGGVDTVKIVYVDPAGVIGTNCDFNDIPAAAAYLRGLPGNRGGIIALKSGTTYSINAVVDLQGLTLKGVGDGVALPLIDALTGGVLRISGTTFDGVVIRVTGGFAGTYFLDVFDDGPNDFLACDFQPAVGKYIFGSSTGLNSTNMTFMDSGQSIQNGSMIDVAAVFPSLTITVLGTSTLGIMRFGARPITTNLDGRADSTTMSSTSTRYFVVAPGENIQARLNALAALGGGVCVLLPGNHNVQTSLLLLSSDIVLRGCGPSSVVRAVVPWLGGLTYYDGVIMIGQKSTATIVNRCSVENLKIEQQTVGPHGGCAYGGDDNRFENCVAEAQADMSAGGYWTGFSMTDSTAAPARRPQMTNCRVQTNGVGTNMYGDGYHMDGQVLGGVSELFGHGNRIYQPLISNCSVDVVFWTAYLLSGCDGARVKASISRRVPQNLAGAILYVLDSVDTKFIGNDIRELPPATTGAFVIILASSPGTEIIGNTIDGAGAIYGWMVFIWDAGWFPGISNRCTIAHNRFRASTVGIEFFTAAMVDCVVGPNTYELVGTTLVDASTAQKYVGTNQQGVGNPNGVVNGDYGDVFLDTATSTLYKCTSYPTGTGWQVI